MFRHRYLVIGIITVLVVLTAVGLAEIVSMKSGRSASDIKGNAGVVQSLETRSEPVFQKDDPPFAVKAKTVSGALYTTEDIPIDIVFKNNAEGTPIKLLNVFDNRKNLQVFFSVTLLDANDTPLFTAGGGKIDLSSVSFKYLELKPGEETSIRINLMDFVPKDVSLKQGVYTVLVIYRNQYGDDCFKGTLKSNSLELSLAKL